MCIENNIFYQSYCGHISHVLLVVIVVLQISTIHSSVKKFPARILCKRKKHFLEFLREDYVNMLKEIPLNAKRTIWFQLHECLAHLKDVKNWVDTHFSKR